MTRETGLPPRPGGRLALDLPGDVATARARLREQLDAEADARVLHGAELALVAFREPLEPGPVTALLNLLADHLEEAMQRQDDEVRDLRRRLHAHECDAANGEINPRPGPPSRDPGDD